MIGKTVSHYRIARQLGAGGMGVVYEAVDTKLDRTVALKFLPPESTRDPQAKARFVREAKAAAGLSHPNIATIHEIDEVDGQLFIVMERVEGQSLRDRIAAGPVPIPEVLDLGRQIAAGLQEAHDRGIVHRDIKPANIMVTPAGMAKILDFGLAWSPDATQLTQDGATVGTIAYLSPEQARAEKVDHRADIWALGSVLHEMVTGRPPFKGEHQQAILHAVLNDDPQPLTGLRTGVPLELERIVAKAMRKNPALRYQSARGVSADLEALAQGESGSLSDTRQLASTSEGPSRRIGIIGSVAVFLVIGAFALKAWWPAAQTVPESEEQTLAVLVFRNLGAEGHLEYLAAGMSEDLIVSLNGVPGLSVLSRGAVEQFRDQSTDPREVGQILGCDYVLDGSVRVVGESLKLTAMLVDAHDGRQVWARSYDAATDEIFALQDSIQTRVAAALNLVAANDGATILSPRWTQNVEAYSYYLAAREIAIENHDDPRVHSRVKQWLDRALALDPFYAPAMAWSGDLIWRRTQAGVYLPDRYARALELVRKAKDIDPRSATVWDRESRVLANFDLGAALVSCQKAIELNPSLPESHNQLGSLLWEMGKHDEALAAWGRVSEVDPYFTFGVANAAMHLSATGDSTRAQEVLDEGLSRLPYDSALRFAQAFLREQVGDEDAAIAGYRETIELNPGDLDSHERLGGLYESQERFAEADSLHLLIATRWPDIPRALTSVGSYFARREQGERAEKYFRQAIRSEQYALYARYLLGRLLHTQERIDEARAEMAEIERIWPRDAQAAYYVGLYYQFEEEDLETAEQWYLKGLTIVPTYWNVLNRLGRLYDSQSRYPEAISMFERMLDQDPLDHYVLVRLAHARMELGDLDAAIRAAEAATKVKPDYPWGWLKLGEALRKHGRRHQAAAAYERLLEFATGNERGYALGYLGDIYFEEGRFRRAIDLWKQANAIHGKPLAWAKVLSTSWWLLDDEEGARAACDELMKDSPDDYHLAIAHLTMAEIAGESGYRAESDSLYAEAEHNVAVLLEHSPNDPGNLVVAALVHARRGRELRARELLDRLIVSQGGSAFYQRNIATVLAVLGDHDAAIAHLEKAFELGLDTTAVIEADRKLADLRKDPRFTALIDKYG